MSMFSLIALFAGTLAWFTSVRITHNAANDFDVDSTTLMVKSISIHNQVNQNSVYIFNSTPAVKYDVNKDKVQFATGYSESSLNNISIRSYSSLSETPDSTLLYLFEIDDAKANSPEEGFSIKIKTDTPNSTASGAMNTNGSLVYKDTNGLAHKLVYDVTQAEKEAMQQENNTLTDDYFGLNSMSSTVSFDIKGYTNLSTSTVNSVSAYDLHNDFATSKVYKDTNDPTKIYNNEQIANDVFGRSSFVTITGSNPNTGDVTYTYSQSIEVFSRVVGQEQACPKYVAVICHYNAEALQYIFNVNLGNPVADSEIVTFTCDWFFELR